MAAYGAVVLSVVICAHLSGVRLGPLFDEEGSKSGMAILKGLAHPDLSSDYLWRILKLSFESLLIGILSTTLAALIGIAASLAAIRVPRIQDGVEVGRYRTAIEAGVRFLVRVVLAVFRSIPEVVWAYLFVRMLGLGPGPAVLGLMVANSGVFGKLFTELAEAVDPEAIYALRRMGVGRFGILIHGVLPQVWRQWVSYTFFRLECSIRSASILGIVGAGGLGSEISLSVRYFEFDKLATTLLAILVFVIAIELTSSILRRRSFKWTLGFALIGSTVALFRLDIPWSELSLDTMIPDWLTDGGRHGGLLVKALKLAAQTVAMAWVATWAAAAVALALSPLTTSTLNTRSARNDALMGRAGLARGLSWATYAGARLFLQATRAMPELALAIVFVVWVGPGPFAGVLAIGVHTIGVMGRLYSDVCEEVEAGTVAAIQNAGASRFSIWLYGIYPQAAPRLLAFTLYRFEVNVRATAMVGFVGAGGIGDAIDTAISLFHGRDLLLLLGVLFVLVVTLDWFGDRVRARLLSRRTSLAATPPRDASTTLPIKEKKRRAPRYACAKGVLFRPRGGGEYALGTIRSVSAVGLFIETERVFPQEMILELGLRPTRSSARHATLPDPSSMCVGRVVYTRPTDGEQAPGIGVELLEPLPEELRPTSG